MRASLLAAALLALAACATAQEIPTTPVAPALAPKLIERDVTVTEIERLRARIEQLERERKATEERASDLELALRRLNERFDKVYSEYAACTLRAATPPDTKK